MNQTGTNRYRQERDFLLYVAQSHPTRKYRNQTHVLQPSNYAAVYTPAANNPIASVGPCLIWRHGLSEGGYGKMRREHSTDLAHRVAFEFTRGKIPADKGILHLCHRRSCIQPAHLYAGTAQDNEEDKHARFAKKVPRLPIHRFFEKYDPLVKAGMKHYWDEPAQNQPPLIPPEHNCTYTIPAGIIDLCQICYRARPHQLSDLKLPDFLEQEAQNRADIRAGLDECCVGRGPQRPPLDFVPKYTRIVVEHTHIQPELTLFLNSQARALIHHPERS